MFLLVYGSILVVNGKLGMVSLFYKHTKVSDRDKIKKIGLDNGSYDDFCI